MSVLAARDIRGLCAGPNPLVSDFKEANLKGASYDLTAGDEYYIYSEADRTALTISELDHNSALVIPPYSVCFVLAREKLTLPLNVTASLSLRLGLLKQGIMLASQPCIDPGYSGKVYAMLHSLSDREVTVKYGDHLLSVEFRYLHEKRDTDKPYVGANQGADHLVNFLDRPVNSSLRSLRDEFVTLRREVRDWRNTVLTFITIALAGLTILVTAMTVWPALRGQGGTAAAPAVQMQNVQMQNGTRDSAQVPASQPCKPKKHDCDPEKK